MEASELVPAVSAQLAAQYRASVQPYLMSWFKYDPAAELAKVTGPVLVIQGTNDLQVSLEDADRLAASRMDIFLVKINGMNHVLKVAPNVREGNFATYTRPLLPLTPDLLPVISDFLTANS